MHDGLLTLIGTFAGSPSTTSRFETVGTGVAFPLLETPIALVPFSHLGETAAVGSDPAGAPVGSGGHGSSTPLPSLNGSPTGSPERPAGDPTSPSPNLAQAGNSPCGTPDLDAIDRAWAQRRTPLSSRETITRPGVDSFVVDLWTPTADEQRRLLDEFNADDDRFLSVMRTNFGDDLANHRLAWLLSDLRSADPNFDLSSREEQQFRLVTRQIVLASEEIRAEEARILEELTQIAERSLRFSRSAALTSADVERLARHGTMVVDTSRGSAIRAMGVPFETPYGRFVAMFRLEQSLLSAWAGEMTFLGIAPDRPNHERLLKDIVIDPHRAEFLRQEAAAVPTAIASVGLCATVKGAVIGVPGFTWSLDQGRAGLVEFATGRPEDSYGAAVAKKYLGDGVGQVVGIGYDVVPGIALGFVRVPASGAKMPASHFPVANSGRTIYSVQDDMAKIWSSGRVWGQTEGSVYGMRIPNAPRWRTMIDPPTRDSGMIIFRENAATLFAPHEVWGPFSGLRVQSHFPQRASSLSCLFR